MIMNNFSINDLFVNAFNFSAIGMAIVSIDGKWLMVNSSLCNILGYTAEELKQKTFQAITHPDDLELDLSNFNKLLKGEIDYYEIVKRYIHKNGCIVWGLLSVSLAKDDQNNPLYTIAQIQDITQRKRMEKEFNQNEDRYRALIESSPNAIVVHQDGKIVYANPQFSSLLKATSEDQIIGQHITKYIHQDYHEMVKERIEMLEKNIPVGALEEKYVLFDGSVIDVEVIANTIVYMDKPAFQVIIHDITKRKEIERKLSQSQEQYRSVVENVKEVIFQTSSEGQWTFLNPAWEKTTGYTIDESMGHYFHDYVHEEDRERYIEQFQSLIQGKQEYFRIEARYLTREKGYCWVEVYTRIALNSQGEIRGTLGTLNDITKRKEYEEELKASEELFRLLAEYSSDLITMHDVNSHFIYISPACKEILQYDVAELVGKDASLFVHPDDQSIVAEKLQILFDTGYTVIPYRFRRKDGEYVWLECACKLLDEIHSGEQKLIAVSRNINERKLSEQKLQEANELLQRLSTIDGLTGVSNRRAFDERMELEWNRGRRNSSFLSLIMLDIDYFKAYNDTYGHQGGDSCLQQIASVIKETLGRSTDLLCRYGGEEFCVILPDTKEVGAKIVGEKIRYSIEKLQIPHAGSEILPWVTISVGTATIIPTVYTSYMDLVSKADKALYKAKNEGRNCVRSY